MGHSGSKEDVEFHQMVGRGFFGEVYKAKYRGARIKSLRSKDAPPYVAVKQVNKSLIREYDLEGQLRREIDILRNISHPNVIKLYFSWEDEQCYYIVMEFVDSNLFEELRSEKKFGPEAAIGYFTGVVHALKYLHEHSILHRDIKPENILVASSTKDSARKTVKIADFGWSNVLSQDESLRNTFCGTLDYLAPEMIKSSGHTFSVDVWSLGVLLYELLSGKSPFGAKTQEETCVRILKLDLKCTGYWTSKFKFVCNSKLRSPSIPEDARDLISKMLKVEASERLSLDDILKHPFILNNRHPSTADPSTSASEPNPLADSCASIEVRRLNKCLKVLEQEVQQVLKSKASTEEKLMLSMDEVEQLMQELKQERRGRRETQERLNSVTQQFESQEKELVKLRSASGLTQTTASKTSSRSASTLSAGSSGASLSGGSSSGGVRSQESSGSFVGKSGDAQGGPGASSSSLSATRPNKFRSVVLSDATEAMLQRLRDAGLCDSKTDVVAGWIRILDTDSSNTSSESTTQLEKSNTATNADASESSLRPESRGASQLSSEASSSGGGSEFELNRKPVDVKVKPRAGDSAQSDDLETYLQKNNPILLQNTIV